MLRPVLYWLVVWLVFGLGCFFPTKKFLILHLCKETIDFSKTLSLEIISMIATIMPLYCRSFYNATIISCALIRYHSL